MVRLLLFTAWVLGAPSLAFRLLAPSDAESAGPAMLVFILSPALAGFLLSRGLPAQPSATNQQKLRGMGRSSAGRPAAWPSPARRSPNML
jgi:hypothetical protein